MPPKQPVEKISESAPAAPASMPGISAPSGVRALITYLLFLHFFFLCVGIKSNTSSSGLDQDLRNKVPGLKAYLQFLEMDLSYMFHLTYYDGERNFQDTDYYFEADIPQPDGSTQLVRLAPDHLVPHIRSSRYGRLGFGAAVASESGDENVASLLPQAVARRLMLEKSCRQLTLRIRRRLLQNLMMDRNDPRAAAERAKSPDDPSYFQTVYQARAFMNDQGEVGIAAVKSAFDTAAPSVEATTPATDGASSAPPTASPTATSNATGGARS